ncbi:nitrilase-related carbon-nitrogen hydrolase [Aeromicrobium sp. P5_D10]
MTTFASAPAGTTGSAPEPHASANRLRLLWLGVGTVLSLFAVHGRLDISLAAWLYMIFLLRFSRTTRPIVAIILVWLVSIAGIFFWVYTVAVPMNPTTAVGAVALGSLVAVPFAVDRVLFAHLGSRTALLLFPLLVVGVQFLIGSISPFGTSIGLLASTQHANLPLLQLISVTGPYVIGFLFAWIATVVNRVWADPSAGRAHASSTGVLGAVLLVTLLGGGLRLAWFPPDSPTVRIVGLSPSQEATGMTFGALGGEPQEQSLSRTDPAAAAIAFEPVNRDLLDRTRQAAQGGAKIVFWSEQAANVTAAGEDAFLAEAAELAREEQIYLQVAEYVHLPKAPYSRNVTRLFDPTGELVRSYDKAHPIPGLEHYPAGPGTVEVVDTPYGRLATVTCFDADFVSLARVDADIMLVPARDWAEVGVAHSQKAALRAVENGYSVVRQGEFGQAAAWDYQGRVLSDQAYATTPALTMVVDVPTEGSRAVYNRIGDIFAWICVAAGAWIVGLGVAARRRGKA